MLKIRLTRKGKKRQPFYRIVVADVEAPRDGRYVELIGTYNPLTDPPSYKIKEDRALHWLSVGAQPTDAVRRLLEKQGTTDRLKRLHAGETIEVLYEEFAGEPLHAEKEEVVAPVKKAAKKAKAAPAKAEKVVEAAPVVEAAAPVVEEVAAVVAEPVVEAAAPVVTEKVDSDKLTKIEGIGPKIAEVLNNNGIHTFAQLAAADADTVKGYLSAAGPQYNRHDPTTWGQQAGMAADGKWDELQKWQDELDGGKAAAGSDAVAEAAAAVEEVAAVEETVVADERTTDIETENTEDAQKATITVTGDDPSTPEVELSETTNVTVTERVIEGDAVEVAEYDSSVEDLIAKYASADESDTAESAEDLIAKYASDGDDAA